MPETEPKPKHKYSRREILNAVKDTLFCTATFGIGLQEGRNITIGELQRQTDFGVSQANRLRTDALEYTAKVEKYDEIIKNLIPPVVIRAYLPGKESPFCTLGFYEIPTSMLCDNEEFLDKIANALALLVPPAFLSAKKVDLVIQSVKPVDKPKKPLSLTPVTESTPFQSPDRIN